VKIKLINKENSYCELGKGVYYTATAYCTFYWYTEQERTALYHALLVTCCCEMCPWRVTGKTVKVLLIRRPLRFCAYICENKSSLCIRACTSITYLLILILILIYLSTAIGLTPGGSTHLYINNT
jgi:hypothetical protein